MLRKAIFGLFLFSGVWWWAHAPGAPAPAVETVERTALVDLDDEAATAVALAFLFGP